MARAYKCDFCKEIFEKKCENRTIGIMVDKWHNEYELDLCDSCYHGIEMLLSGNAKLQRTSKNSFEFCIRKEC